MKSKITKTLPTTTDANRQYMLLGRALVVLGLCAVATVMWMTGRFGWSLQEAAVDRWVSACLHMLNDAAGAALVVASSVMFGMPEWRTRIMGVIALICALLLVAYSVVSVYGFMSTRIVHLESHNRIVAYQQGAIDWTRKTIINRDLPKSERQILRDELRLADKELKSALRFIPDAQAAGIAAWFDTTVERVQRALVIVTSSVGQLIKVACLFFGFSFLSYCSKGGPSSTDRPRAGDGQGGRINGGGPIKTPAQAEAWPVQAEATLAQVGATLAQVEARSAQAEANTAQVEARSAQAEARPAHVEARFAQAEAKPAQVEARSAQVEAKPAQADVRSGKAVARPAQATSGGKFTRDQVENLLRLVINGRLSLSTHAIVRKTGWPRSTIRDMRRRLAGIDTALGKFASSGRRLYRT
jgi:hypothetical protein